MLVINWSCDFSKSFRFICCLMIFVAEVKSIDYSSCSHPHHEPFKLGLRTMIYPNVLSIPTDTIKYLNISDQSPEIVLCTVAHCHVLSYQHLQSRRQFVYFYIKIKFRFYYLRYIYFNTQHFSSCYIEIKTTCLQLLTRQIGKYLVICLSIYLSTYLLTYLSIAHLPMYPSIYLSNYLCTYISTS